jgi:hypothetical protein
LNEGRQKTLSVKWRQSTAETKLRDRKQNLVKIEPIVDNNNGVENLCQESLITLSPNSITNTTHLTTLTTHNSDIDLSYNPNSRSFRRTVNRIGTTRRDDTKNGTYLFNGKSDSCWNDIDYKKNDNLNENETLNTLQIMLIKCSTKL